MILRSLSKQPLKSLHAPPNNPERLLECMSKIIKLVNDTSHRESIREEKQLSRPFDISILHDVKLSDSFDLKNDENRGRLNNEANK